MGKIKTIAKKALKATPPGMMVTAGKKAIEELKRLTQPKKPGARAPIKKIPKTKKPRKPKYGKDLTTKQKEKILKQPRKAPPRLIRDRINRRKK